VAGWRLESSLEREDLEMSEKKTPTNLNEAMVGYEVKINAKGMDISATVAFIEGNMLCLVDGTWSSSYSGNSGEFDEKIINIFTFGIITIEFKDKN
jgi:hypothetical protein